MTYDLDGVHGHRVLGDGDTGTATQVRAKMVMRASTQVEDRGACDESVLGPNRCGDEWGDVDFHVAQTGPGRPVTVRFSGAGFAQEGWGQAFPWNPADVFGIQFQTVTVAYPGGLYDFWIDDIYLVR